MNAERLAQTGAFSGIKPQTVAALAANASERTAVKNDVLYKPDEAWPYVGLLLDGLLGMFAEGGNRDYLYEQVAPAGFFGVAGMFDAGFTMARMVVLSKTAAYVQFHNRVVRRLCDEDPALTMLLASVLAHRVRGLTGLLKVQVNEPTMTRIARYLLQYCGDRAGLAPTSDALGFMTQAQIAAAAGTTKEVAARQIRTLEDAFALRREGGRIRYLDRERIELFATVSALRRQPDAAQAQ